MTNRSLSRLPESLSDAATAGFLADCSWSVGLEVLHTLQMTNQPGLSLNVQLEHFQVAGVGTDRALIAASDSRAVWPFGGDDVFPRKTTGAVDRRGVSHTSHLSTASLFTRVHLMHLHWSVVGRSVSVVTFFDPRFSVLCLVSPQTLLRPCISSSPASITVRSESSWSSPFWQSLSTSLSASFTTITPFSFHARHAMHWATCTGFSSLQLSHIHFVEVPCFGAPFAARLFTSPISLPLSKTSSVPSERTLLSLESSFSSISTSSLVHAVAPSFGGSSFSRLMLDALADVDMLLYSRLLNALGSSLQMYTITMTDEILKEEEEET